MKQINWPDILPGDIGLVRSSGIQSDLIVDFEHDLHADYTGQFMPSHVFIVGYNGMVIEATAAGMTAINPIAKYQSSPVQFYRIERTGVQMPNAIDSYLRQYGTYGYGWTDLLGFAIEAFERHLGNPKAQNPILHGYVCSQGALIFLRYPAVETWPLQVELRDCDPLGLLMQCQRHSVKE